MRDDYENQGGRSSRTDDPAERFMIEIKRPGEKLDMPSISKLLGETGIKLDPSYGPFLVNPKDGRYVVRGFVSAEARKKIEVIHGVTLYRDRRIIRPV